MDSIHDMMADDHSRCDDLFAAAEEAVSAADWDRAMRDFAAFRDALEHHFMIEESVLFPAFEARTGMIQGPTEVMRMEHAQMREFLEQMDEDMHGRSADGYLGLSETLLILMQQHNAKEEQVLYPMADQVLAAQRDALIEKMRALADVPANIRAP